MPSLVRESYLPIIGHGNVHGITLEAAGVDAFQIMSVERERVELTTAGISLIHSEQH
jgi:hypothetical protein